MNTRSRKTIPSAMALALLLAAGSSAAWARDRIPPTVPEDFSAQPVNQNQVRLQWAESIDNFGIERYHLMRDGAVVTKTSQLSYVDSGLDAGNSYRYELMADDGENYSYVSSIVVTIPIGSRINIPSAEN